MPAPVVIEFLARGVPDVARAFKSVEDTIKSSERASSRAAGGAAAERQRIAQREAQDKIRAWLKADAEVRRARDKGVREAERAARAESRAAERAAREKVRAMIKSDNEIRRIQEKAVRDTERAEAAKSRAIAREEAKRTREAVREESKRKREAAREAKKQQAIIAAIDRETEKRGEQFRSAVFGGASKAASFVAKGVSAVGSVVSQLGGGFSIADSIQRQADLEREAVRFSNSAYMGTGQRMKAADLMSRARAASIATGIDAGELMKSAAAFGAKTGEYGEGLDQMKFMGEIAQGTGANVEDVAKAAGTLRVQNEHLKPEQMKQILLQTVRQGQKGSIEFADLATAAGKITRTSSGYAGDQAKTQGELLGLAQLGMATMSDPRDVATSLAGIESDSKKKWRRIEAAMPGTFDESGRIKKGPSEYFADLMEKSGGDTRKLQELGFGKQAMKYFQALAPTFQDAGGGKAGRAAVMAKMKDITESSMPYSELQENVKAVMNTSAAQFENTMRELRTVVGTELLPEFLKLVPTIKESIPIVRDLSRALIGIVNWAKENPFAGLGALVGGFIMKELAVAGIGSSLKAAVGGGAGGPSGGGGAGVSLPGGGSSGGSSNAGGVLGAMGAGAALAMQLKYGGEQVDRVTNAWSAGDTRANQLAAMMRAGDRGGAEAGLAQAEQDSSIGNWALTALHGTARASKYLTGPLGIAGQWASDAVVKGVTGKGPSDEEQITRTIAAEATTRHADEIRAATTTTVSALNDFAQALGVAGDAARKKPLSDR